jgi:hypothetical protein
MAFILMAPPSAEEFGNDKSDADGCYDASKRMSLNLNGKVVERLFSTGACFLDRSLDICPSLMLTPPVRHSLLPGAEKQGFGFCIFFLRSRRVPRSPHAFVQSLVLLPPIRLRVFLLSWFVSPLESGRRYQGFLNVKRNVSTQTISQLRVYLIKMLKRKDIEHSFTAYPDTLVVKKRL